MPLNETVFSVASQSVGNAYNLGGRNASFSTNIQCSFNYNFSSDDYVAGAVQFVYVLSLQLALSIGTQSVPARDSNPRRFLLGEVAIETLAGISERKPIEALNQAVIATSRLITLQQNEAAAPKRLSLAARPRFVASNAAAQELPFRGSVATQAGILSGLIAAPTVIGGTFSGTYTPTGPVSALTQVARRQLQLDVTDGDLQLITIATNPESRQLQNFNQLGDLSTPRVFRIFLLPGVVGTAALTVQKAGESRVVALPGNTPYQPGTFPAI